MQSSSLRIEVWAQILTWLVPSVNESDIRLSSRKQSSKDQAAFYGLRLVCKAFNQVFVSHPDLCRGLVVTQPMVESFDSLMLWLKRYHAHVQTFADYAGHPARALVWEALPSGQQS